MTAATPPRPTVAPSGGGKKAALSGAPPPKPLATVGDLARTWPQGRFDEAPAVFAAVLVAVAQLLGWIIAVLARLLFDIIRLLALGMAFVATKISGERLKPRGALVIGWLLVIAVLLGTATSLGVTHGLISPDLLARFRAGHSTPHKPVPYQAPSPACAAPRAVCAAPTELLDGQPSLSAAKILTVLQSYHSPAATAEFADALYDLGIKYGINPAYALGFFTQESSCGTQGLAVNTLSIGNIRYSTSSSPVSYADYQGFRQYANWRDGAEDWFWLMRTYYLSQGLRDIYDITPIYAPSNDNNNPTQYARNVYNLVVQWSGS